MKYTKHVHLNSDDLRELCINRNWYTCGDIIDYNHLFIVLRQANDQQNGITDEDIQRIAEDIHYHSDESGYTVAEIMSAIAFKCVTYYEEA